MIYEEYFRITNDTDFKRNPGQLTNVGRHQLYLLGRSLGDKYIRELKFLSSNYNPQEIFIRTSGFNRTIESAQSILQGLYQQGTGPYVDDRQAMIAKPPIKVENFDELRIELRDAALPNYMESFVIHTSQEVEDYWFNPHEL